MPTKIKASDIFTPDEISYIKFIMELFKGKVVDVQDAQKEGMGIVLKVRPPKVRRRKRVC